jgi:hypothetical protein
MSAGRAPMYCHRCDEVVSAILPWPGWKPALYVWYVVMGLIVVLFPVMAADYCVMIPTMMCLIIAGSPLHRFAGEKPVCCICSAELAPGKESGTGVHVKRTR